MTERPPKISRKAAIASIFGTVMVLDRTLAHAADLPEPLFPPPSPVVPMVDGKPLPIAVDEEAKKYARQAELVRDGEKYVIETKYQNVEKDTRDAELKMIRETYVPKIEKIVKEKNIALEPSLQDALLGIILIESKGEATADNGVAKGLCQITYATLTEVSKKTPELLDKNMLDAENNIWAAATYLEILAKEYGSEYAVWMFHLGPGRLLDAMARHLTEKGVADLDDKEIGMVRKHRRDLSVPELVDSSAVQGFLDTIYSGEAYEGALYYSFRVAAGIGIIKAAK